MPLPIIALADGPGFVDIVTPWFFFGVVPFGAGRLLGEHESLTAELRERTHPPGAVSARSVESGHIPIG